MAVNIGPKIGVDGEAEYRRQINQIIQQSKTLESQMKLVASQFTSATTAEEKNAKTAAVVAALSEGYEQAQAYEVPGYKPRPLTVDEVMTLRMDEFAKLQQAALAAWTEDSRPTVEVEPEKKEGGEDQASS